VFFINNAILIAFYKLIFKIYTFYKVYIIIVSPFKALFKNLLKYNISLIKDKQIVIEIL
jgi:hypothetical protein